MGGTPAACGPAPPHSPLSVDESIDGASSTSSRDVDASGVVPPSTSASRHLMSLSTNAATDIMRPSSCRPEKTQRRHMLSRSQKSSSECFSVNFEVDDEGPAWETELFFPATRGVTLHEAIAKQCQLRNVDLSQCDVWLTSGDGMGSGCIDARGDTAPPPTLTSISFDQDTVTLVGRHLRITSRDQHPLLKSRTTPSASAIHQQYQQPYCIHQQQHPQLHYTHSVHYPQQLQHLGHHHQHHLHHHHHTHPHLQQSQSMRSTKAIPLSQTRKTSSIRPRTTSFFSASTEDTSSWAAGGGSAVLSGGSLPENRLPPSSSVAQSPATTAASATETGAAGAEQGKTPKQPKQRWSTIFSNNKDTKMMESLIDQLSKFTPTSQVYPQGQTESIDALYKLEDDWTQILDSRELTERQQKQQTALWELIRTEVAYIKTLKVVTDLFIACLRSLQSVQLLKEINTEKLFSNIADILDANVLFWRNSLFPVVRQMRQTGRPGAVTGALCEGFARIRDTFAAYFQYCAEQARCQHYCRENHGGNELFTAYLAWCETQKDCNRLRLMDILVQPMQRLTKYGLLLKAIQKNTDDEAEQHSLEVMIQSVDDFVISVNFSLKQRQDNERLKGLIARIESYDIVESKDDDLEKFLKTFSQLDLNRPMLNCPAHRKRHLLLEGDLKLKDGNSSSKIEVHCFLLTDMLLICKPSTRKGGATMRVIRQPYLIDRLVPTELTKDTPSLACVYKNEFDMAVSVFILQNNDAKKLKAWKEAIVKAKALYEQAKQEAPLMPDEGGVSPLIMADNSECSFEYLPSEGEYHSLQLIPRSPLATSSSRASRVSSLAHSHSGSVEMNDQSSLGSGKDVLAAAASRNNVSSMETAEPSPIPVQCSTSIEQLRASSISSDEGSSGTGPPCGANFRRSGTNVAQAPPTASPSVATSARSTPNTLSVQSHYCLGQSLPNLTVATPSTYTLGNTLSVPGSRSAAITSAHLLSPTHRGISYPPPSPTRGNLRRGVAITPGKNPPLIKTRHVNSVSVCGGNVSAAPAQQLSATSTLTGSVPTVVGTATSLDFDVPMIAGISTKEEHFARGQHRQAILKRIYRNDNKRSHTTGTIDDLKKTTATERLSMPVPLQKRLSWNSQETIHPFAFNNSALDPPGDDGGSAT